MLIKFLDGTKREIANLRSADLRSADLRSADLRNASLHGADLGGADLRSADLRNASLRGADLTGADLRSADLRGANLSGANLRNASLRGADLTGAYLRGANLRGADLRSADLRGADLTGADLYGADLGGADLDNAKGLARFKVCPEVGAFIGFKKVAGTIITLLIPADAKRVNAYGSRKCRAEFAYVQAVDGVNNGLAYGGFKYPASGMVAPDKFDPDPRVECSNGIHFFITRQEAEDYS